MKQAKFTDSRRRGADHPNYIPLEHRFFSNVKKVSSGCIEWQRSLDSNGYGRITVNGKVVRCHRIALMLAGTDIPKGLEVCHKCDNPKCVNVDHLEVSTHKKNILDAVDRGLWTVCKLTQAQVATIRRTKYRRGLFLELSKKYGVVPTTISNAYNRKTYPSL